MLDFLSFRLLFKSKVFLAFILISFYSVSILASSYHSPWYKDWEPDISPDSCGLAVFYADKNAVLNPRIRMDEYVTFDSFRLRFSIPIREQKIAGKTFTKGALYLYLISHTGEKLSNKQHRIIAVSSRGNKFKTYTIDHSPSTRLFYLETAAARSIFNALRRTEKTELILTLDDKTSRTLTIRNQHSDRFSILADMLKACYISRVSRPAQSD